MGSTIFLGLGRLEVDWGKNSFFQNHSALFKREDVGSELYYDAYDATEWRPAYSRELRSVVRRLELLGYTLKACEQDYADAIAIAPTYYPPPSLSFEEFAELLVRVDVDKVRRPWEEDQDLGELAQSVLRDREFIRSCPELASLSSFGATFFENLHPYVVLRLLAENPDNLCKRVAWRFADVVEGGWVSADDLYEGVPASDRCLVVTEGSLDGALLSASLPIVAPDVADFFDFVDTSENYPFIGTGNVYRFCQGLARIKVQNRILVVLDNDTAGRLAYQRISALNLPARMRVTLLPELDEFRRMPTIGPTGTAFEDANGKAVSIECFLDLEAPESPETMVRWTSYHPEIDAYQGSLANKEVHAKRFLKAARQNRSYDTRKLELLWRHLIAVTTASSYSRSKD